MCNVHTASDAQRPLQRLLRVHQNSDHAPGRGAATDEIIMGDAQRGIFSWVNSITVNSV